nr:uncharacterized protein LOC105345710 [Crassostrea gigas]
MCDKDSNKRGFGELSIDMSRSFSEVVQAPKKSKDGSISDQPPAIPSQTSTPEYNRTEKNDTPTFVVTGPFTICDDDIQRIAVAVKSLLSAELATISTQIQDIVKAEVHKATQPLKEKVNVLEKQNKDLFQKVDELEQYGRRPLVRVAGIPETADENTSDKILEAVSAVGIPLQREDIIVSHRVGKPDRNRTRPRQIIARLKSVDLKFHLVKNSKKFKNNPSTRNVAINEDLTKYRDRLLFLGRQLCRNHNLKSVSSSNGKIKVFDLNNRAHYIREEADLIQFGHVINSD